MIGQTQVKSNPVFSA